MAILRSKVCRGLEIVFTISNEYISVKEMLHTDTSAQIYTDMDAIFIEDTDSQVSVNGNKIFIHQLKEGDVICVNELQLVFSYKKITFPCLNEKPWDYILDVWSRSSSVNYNGYGAAGTIELGVVFLLHVFANRSEFPDELFFDALLRHESIIVAGYSFWVLLYRNSCLLENDDEWKKPRLSKICYKHACSSSTFLWAKFIEVSTPDILSLRNVYSATISNSSYPEHNRVLRGYLDHMEYSNNKLWFYNDKSYKVLITDDFDSPLESSCEEYGSQDEEMKCSAKKWKKLKGFFGDKININPFFY